MTDAPADAPPDAPAASDDGPLFPRDLSWHPPALHPPYRTSVARSPRFAPVSFPQTPSELTGPAFGQADLGPLDDDLTLNFARPGESAIGPRIIVHGRILDETGRGVPGALVEVWQANAGGRYRHKKDGYLAPLDPDFGGCGRCVTAEDGSYRFRTVQPGPYPWPNGPNEWRPAHIHFSLFGPTFGHRLITQMYFEGDPLIPLCPIAGGIPSDEGRDALTARLDWPRAEPMDALAWRFDLVLRGRRRTPFENRAEGMR